MQSVLISFLCVFVAWLLCEVVSRMLLRSFFNWQLPLLCQHINDNKLIGINYYAENILQCPEGTENS